MITWLIIIGVPVVLVGSYVAKLTHWAYIGGASWSGVTRRRP